MVINVSGTIPAAIDAVDAEGDPLVVHLSTRLDATEVGGRAAEDWSIGPPVDGPARRRRAISRSPEAPP